MRGCNDCEPCGPLCECNCHNNDADPPGKQSALLGATDDTEDDTEPGVIPA